MIDCVSIARYISQTLRNKIRLNKLIDTTPYICVELSLITPAMVGNYPKEMYDSSISVDKIHYNENIGVFWVRYFDNLVNE